MKKLTTCKACGMQWTAKDRETCPRCELARAHKTISDLGNTVAELEADLERVRAAKDPEP